MQEGVSVGAAARGEEQPRRPLKRGCSARRTWGPGAPSWPDCSCASDLMSAFPRVGLPWWFRQ